MIAHLTWRGSNVSARVIKETNIYTFFKLLRFIFSCKSIIAWISVSGRRGQQEHKAYCKAIPEGSYKQQPPKKKKKSACMYVSSSKWAIISSHIGGGSPKSFPKSLNTIFKWNSVCYGI